MSVGGFLDSSSSSGGRRVGDNVSFLYNSSRDESSAINMPSGAIAQPRLLAPSLVKPMLSSPGLSLALVQTFLFPLKKEKKKMKCFSTIAARFELLSFLFPVF